MRTTVSRLLALLLCALLCVPTALATRVPSVTLDDVVELDGDKYQSLNEAVNKAPSDGTGELTLLRSVPGEYIISKPLTIHRAGFSIAGLSAGKGYIMVTTEDMYQFFAEGFSASCVEEKDRYIFTVTYQLSPFEEGESGILFAACYDHNGKMIGVVSKELIPAENGTTQLVIETSESVSSAKVFMLDDHFVPLFAADTVTIDLRQDSNPESTEII